MNPFSSRFSRHGGHCHGQHPLRGTEFPAHPQHGDTPFEDRRAFFEHRHPHGAHADPRGYETERFQRHAGPRGGGFEFFRGGRGGRGQGDGFDDPRGRGRGARPLGHGDLRLLMLSFIAEQPRHGYELIRLIEALFHGAYTPSPGAIYPTLSQLEDMGLIAATQEEGRKRYAITEEGREHVAAAREEIDAALSRTHRSARDVAKAQIPAPVREALRRIKRGLISRHGRWSDDEIARVAALLDAAADAMDGPRPD